MSNIISINCNNIIEKKAIFSIVSDLSQKEILHSYFNLINYENNNVNDNEYFGITKINFAIYSLVYSIIQKCNFCMQNNYEILKKENLSIDNLSDIGRIVSVIKGLSVILNAPPSMFPKPIYL